MDYWPHDYLYWPDDYWPRDYAYWPKLTFLLIVASVIVEHRPDLIVELAAAGMIVELEHRPDLLVGLRADP